MPKVLAKHLGAAAAATGAVVACILSRFETLSHLPLAMNLNRRSLLAISAASALSTVLGGCASMLFSSTDYDIVVDARHKGLPGEMVGGRPTYKSVQAALDSLPVYATKSRRIFIRSGRYYEKLVIDKAFVSLIGEDRRDTLLSFDAYSGQQKPDGSGKWGTWACATLIVRAPDFSAENLSIENGYDYPTNDVKDAKDPTRTNDPQAVALMTDAGSDRALFRRVNISGHQDTLFANAGRAVFQESRISGNVDFIFGAGQALFEECEIVTRARSKPGVDPIGYVTAPSTQIANAWGMVFLRCKLLRENDKVPAKSSPLGRPWHPTTTFADGRYADPNAIGSTVFIDCFMDEHITVDGWAAMSGTPKTGTEKTWFQPEDSRFFEYRSKGPGAAVNPKRRQLTDVQAAQFSRERLLGDWRF